MRTLLPAACAALLFSACAPAVEPADERPRLITADFADNPYIEREDVRFASDGAEIAGTILTPADRPIRAGAVVIQGSGDSGRANQWSGMIAQLFAENGVVVLLTDKRGVGGSSGDWREADFNDYADDAIAAARFLRNHVGDVIPPGRIGVIGLSQGGHVAPLAVTRAPGEFAFVVNISGAALILGEQIRHEIAATYARLGITGPPLDRLRETDALVERLLAGEDVWEAYRASADRFIGTELEGLASEIYPADRNDWRLDWYPRVVAFDPLPHWREVAAPIFVVYGAEDERNNVPVRESVVRLNSVLGEAGHGDFVVRVYEGAGHGLFAPGSRSELHPQFVEDVSAWLQDRFPAPAR